jgi:hypothetical protein
MRTNGLSQITADDATGALRLLVDRRDELSQVRTEIIYRCITCNSSSCRAQKIPVRSTGPRTAGHSPATRHRRAHRRQLAAELNTELGRPAGA